MTDASNEQIHNFSEWSGGKTDPDQSRNLDSNFLSLLVHAMKVQGLRALVIGEGSGDMRSQRAL